MKVLVLGGTQFIGRHIAETLLAAGHTVTVLNRGRTPDELPAAIERLRGDRDQGAAGLQALAGGTWDVCVDVSGFTPPQVRPSAERLRPVVQRYLFISAVSVYGDPREGPVRESHPLLPPAGEKITEISQETYGALKVACENVVQEVYGERATIFRPQVVAGPYDPSGRHTYWVQRAQQGGEMLAPGDGSDFVQVIDVRDLARFAATVIERDLAGSFNLVGPRLTWAEFLQILGSQNLVWVPAEILRAAGVTAWELPLYRQEGSPRSQLMNASSERARAAGLTLTDPEITARETWSWLKDRNEPLKLAPEREAELIRRSRSLG
jgi:2'-hydroxyisoflavone reductase